MERGCMQKKYAVKLTAEERIKLDEITRNPKEKAKKVIKSKILLKLDENQEEGHWDAQKASEAYDISVKTIYRMKRQFVEEGYEAALTRRPYPKGLRRKFDGEKEAQLIAVCCSKAPEGHSRWSLRLLANKIVELEILGSISHEGIRKMLKKTNLNLG